MSELWPPAPEGEASKTIWPPHHPNFTLVGMAFRRPSQKSSTSISRTLS